LNFNQDENEEDATKAEYEDNENEEDEENILKNIFEEKLYTNSDE
jgi:hypothetical protein